LRDYTTLVKLVLVPHCVSFKFSNIFGSYLRQIIVLGGLQVLVFLLPPLVIKVVFMSSIVWEERRFHAHKPHVIRSQLFLWLPTLSLVYFIQIEWILLCNRSYTAIYPKFKIVPPQWWLNFAMMTKLWSLRDGNMHVTTHLAS